MSYFEKNQYLVSNMNVKVIAEIGCNHKGDIEIISASFLMQKNVVLT